MTKNAIPAAAKTPRSRYGQLLTTKAVGGVIVELLVKLTVVMYDTVLPTVTESPTPWVVELLT